MNSLTYISRQFDVLASSSASASTPPSPSTPNSHITNPTDDISFASTSSAIPDNHQRPLSQTPVIRKPSRPMSRKKPSSGLGGSSSSPTSPRTSPSPRRRRKRRVASAYVLRPLFALWHLLYALWLWIGQHTAEPKEAETSISGSITFEAHPGDHTDETLVDSDAEDDVRVALSLSDSRAAHSSTKSAASILLSPSSTTTSEQSRSNRIRISFPQNINTSRDPSLQGTRPRLTPYPSKERLSTSEEIDDVERDINDFREPTSLQLNIIPPSPERTSRELSPPSRVETAVSPIPSSDATTLALPPPSQRLLPNPLRPSYLTSSRAPQAVPTRTPSPRAPTPFHRPKTLVLDLDETLVHATSSRTPLPSTPTNTKGGMFDLGGLFIGGGFGGTGLLGATLGGGLLAGTGGLLGHNARARGGHMVEVVLGGRSTLYTVYKRPFVDYFLRKVSTWYTVVIFTASMQEYADPVIDWLDAGRGILSRRFFRESCTQLPNGTYAKDLSLVDPDLSRICMIDNMPVSYSIDQANGIPIEGWYSDPSDEALLDLLPVLDSLRFTSDVRRVLGIKAF